MVDYSKLVGQASDPVSRKITLGDGDASFVVDVVRMQNPEEGKPSYFALTFPAQHLDVVQVKLRETGGYDIRRPKLVDNDNQTLNAVYTGAVLPSLDNFATALMGKEHSRTAGM